LSAIPDQIRENLRQLVRIAEEQRKIRRQAQGKADFAAAALF